jgi:DNA-directed RNA polymerase subunit H (RpoH/RPB5)
MSSNSRILTIYRSRQILLEQLEELGYNTSEYLGFSKVEIEAMFDNEQMDMILKHSVTERKVYVRYHVKSEQKSKASKQMKSDGLAHIIEDLYVNSKTLTLEDTLLVLQEQEPNESILHYLVHLFEHDKKFVVVQNIHALLFNVMKHELNPRLMRVLNEDEEREIMQKYRVSKEQLPEISREDPVAKAMLVRPGQIVYFERSSRNALVTPFYRLCS